MARNLESLVAHYAQMAAALKDSEAGEMFSEEELRGSVVTGPVALAVLTAHVLLSDE